VSAAKERDDGDYLGEHALPFEEIKAKYELS
jgi:hypothetical protein